MLSVVDWHQDSAEVSFYPVWIDLHRFLEKTLAEWLAVFEDTDIPYGPVQSMDQVFSDPQVLYNNMILEMNHPTAGNVRAPGREWSFVAIKQSLTVFRLDSPRGIWLDCAKHLWVCKIVNHSLNISLAYPWSKHNPWCVPRGTENILLANFTHSIVTILLQLCKQLWQGRIILFTDINKTKVHVGQSTVYHLTVRWTSPINDANWVRMLHVPTVEKVSCVPGWIHLYYNVLYTQEKIPVEWEVFGVRF